MESKSNTTITSLDAGESFIGTNVVVNGFLNIVCNLKTTKDCVIRCEQSTNGTDYQFSDQFAHVVSVFGEQTRTQFFVKAYYARIMVFNSTIDDIPKIVLTTLLANENRDSSLEQPDVISGDVSVITPMKAKDYDDGSIRDLACDANGNLKINVAIDDLLPTDDGIACYGSTDGTQSNTKLIKTTADGKLVVDKVEEIEVNANKDNITTLDINVATDFAIDESITSAIDLGTGKDRMRNVCFSGAVGLATHLTPKIVMSFSDNNNDFFEDGVYANFYKANALEWTFNFQRSNVGQRYVKLKAENATTINKCRTTQSKL